MTKPKPVKISSTPICGPRPAAVPVSDHVIDSDIDPNKRRLDYFKKLMSKGEVSKAYLTPWRACLSFSPSIRLRNLFLSPGRTPVTPDQMDEEPILLSFKSVVKIIRASCGVDNFPIDILKQLSKTLVKKEFPVGRRTILELLTAFFNRFFTFGHCPPEVLHFYDAGDSIRLLQGARPIGKATTYRNVAHLLPHRVELQEEFGDIQFCVWGGHLSGLSECRMRSTCISSVSIPIYPTAHLTTPMLTTIQNGGQL